MPRDSISLSPDVRDIVKEAAARKGVSMKEYLSRMVIDLGVADPDTEKVAFSIPRSVLGDENGLREWLDSKSKSLLKYYFPNTEV